MANMIRSIVRGGALLLMVFNVKAAEAGMMASDSVATRTVCFGRHQMALPADFEQTMGTSAMFTPTALAEGGAPIEVSVRSASIEPGEYKRAVDKRHAELKELQNELTDVVKEVIQVNKEAIIFRVMRIDDAYKSELHLWKGGSYVVASTKSFRNTFKQAEERLLALAANMDATASAPPGAFCLGPVAINGNYAGEDGRLSFRSRANPDMLVTVTVETYKRDSSQPLLARMSGGNSLLAKFSANHKALRKGERKVAGMRAQEWLGWVMLGKQGEHKSYGFALETLRPTPGPEQPRIFIEFKTGKQGGLPVLPNSALNDEEAISLWDAIVSTIRLGS